jgi:hypothetical protein
VGNGGEDGWLWKIVLVHCVGPRGCPAILAISSALFEYRGTLRQLV